jgi:hypothetical protein
MSPTGCSVASDMQVSCEACSFGFRHCLGTRGFTAVKCLMCQESVDLLWDLTAQLLRSSVAPPLTSNLQ